MDPIYTYESALNAISQSRAATLSFTHLQTVTTFSQSHDNKSHCLRYSTATATETSPLPLRSCSRCWCSIKVCLRAGRTTNTRFHDSTAVLNGAYRRSVTRRTDRRLCCNVLCTYESVFAPPHQVVLGCFETLDILAICSNVTDRCEPDSWRWRYLSCSQVDFVEGGTRCLGCSLILPPRVLRVHLG